MFSRGCPSSGHGVKFDLKEVLGRPYGREHEPTGHLKGMTLWRARERIVVPLPSIVQGYLAHKKQPPPPSTTLGA